MTHVSSCCVLSIYTERNAPEQTRSHKHSMCLCELLRFRLVFFYEEKFVCWVVFWFVMRRSEWEVNSERILSSLAEGRWGETDKEKRRKYVCRCLCVKHFLIVTLTLWALYRVMTQNCIFNTIVNYLIIQHLAASVVWHTNTTPLLPFHFLIQFLLLRIPSQAPKWQNLRN